MGLIDNQKYVQTSFFSMVDPNQTNCIALYDLAPRFVRRVERPEGKAYLEAIKRDFTYGGVEYRVTVSPARLIDTDGKERDELPGEREQLVEDVISRFAADCMKVQQDQIEIPFTIYAIMKELSRHGHTFSRTEIKDALLILNKSNIEIVKIVQVGEKKPKPLLSASAYPVLKLSDANDPEMATVQLNPLFVQAIKSLAFEQIDYDWMMQIKGHLPRLIFKYISLVLAEREKETTSITITASEIANTFGQFRKRWRATLAEVEKSIERLKEYEVIGEYTKTDVWVGKKKEDITFTLQFSDKYMKERKGAKVTSVFARNEAQKLIDPNSAPRFQPLEEEVAHSLMFQRKQIQYDLNNAK